MTRTVGTRIWDANGLREGHAVLDEEGTVRRVEEAPSLSPDLPGLVVPAPVNAHTHLADRALRGQAEDLTLEETVAPPDGLKHRFLRGAEPGRILESFQDGLLEVERSRARAVFDFREGGPPGARLARQAAQASPVDVTLLGRPTTPEAWDDQAPLLRDLVDGLGISGINDQPLATTRAQADWCHQHDLLVAIHVSEGQREDLETVLSLQPDLLVHGTFFTREDARLVADEDIPLTLCPRANHAFGNQPPVDLLEAEGVRWTLGTDNALFHQADVWEEARHVATRHKVDPMSLLEGLCRDPITGSLPRLEEGMPAVVLDDADGLDRALATRRVTAPRRQNLARERTRTSVPALVDSDRRE